MLILIVLQHSPTNSNVFFLKKMKVSDRVREKNGASQKTAQAPVATTTGMSLGSVCNLIHYTKLHPFPALTVLFSDAKQIWETSH